MHNTVYDAYRLHPRDLDGPRAVAIRRVTYEGVEELRPVLYFEGLPKPLVLSGEQARALARWTGEALCERWVGHGVTLSPAEGGILMGQASVEPRQRERVRPSFSLPPMLTTLPRGGTGDARPAGWTAWLLLLILGLLFLIVVLLEGAPIAPLP